MRHFAATVGVLVALAVTGCGAPVLSLPTAGGEGRGCADTVMAQVATTKPVQGAWECLAPAMLQIAHEHEVYNREAFARGVGNDGGKVSYVGSSKGRYVYLLSVGERVVPYAVRLDKVGKVDSVS